ncbi:hypothetical protein E2C01_062923 [Portunus trituberculatus]|uniref:Uncharacterized protein n=1 Tax=Portunus trituberculatus TaxID=210409 RepID=A0A5B7HIW6_PORTR|nr:hypothetical protein [Portunus trituberculatus]
MEKLMVAVFIDSTVTVPATTTVVMLGTPRTHWTLFACVPGVLSARRAWHRLALRLAGTNSYSQACLRLSCTLRFAASPHTHPPPAPDT